MVTATPSPNPTKKPKKRVPEGASISAVYRSRPTNKKLLTLRRRYGLGAASVLRILLDLFGEDPGFHQALAEEKAASKDAEWKPNSRRRRRANAGNGAVVVTDPVSKSSPGQN